MSRLQAHLLLLGCAAVWGLAFVFQKQAMDHVGPLLFIAARATLATLTLAPLAVIESRRRDLVERRRTARALWRYAAAGALAFLAGATLQQTGLLTATVTNAGFLTGLYVVAVPLMAWAWSRIAPAAIVWPAIALSFLGTWLLGGGTIGGLSTGDLLILGSSLFWAAHVVIVGRSAVVGRPVTFTALQFALMSVLAFAAALSLEPVRLDSLSAAALEIAYVGILSSALTFTVMAVAMRVTPPAETAILLSLETVFAAIAGALLLGERLTLTSWAGAALILAATLLVQLWPVWRRQRRGLP